MFASVQDVLKNIVVYIRVNGKVQGTGFFINEFGNILTCYHIFSKVSLSQGLDEINENSIEIEFQNKRYPAKAIYASSNPYTLDISILTIAIQPQEIHLSNFKSYDSTEALVTCGYRSEEIDHQRCNGLVHIEHSEEIKDFIILDDSSSHHKIMKGLSGSPIVEVQTGAVVGMIVGRFNEKFEEYDEAIAIPISKISLQFEPLNMKMEQYKKYKQLENIFVKNEFLSVEKQELLSEEFCQLFLEDRTDLFKCRDFTLILDEIKERNLIDTFIEWIPYWIDKSFKKELAVDKFHFENREKHLLEIISEKEGSTFITIDGALSCGKTHMLLKLQESFEKESWLCYFIRSSHSPTTADEVAMSLRNAVPFKSKNSNEIGGYALGNHILKTQERLEQSFEKKIKGVALLFDDIDRIESEVEFENFLKLIRELNSVFTNNEVNSKIVIAGNSLSDKIESFDYSFDFVRKKKKIVLKPFKYPYVKKFIENRTEKPIQNINCVTARFFYLTNGHPGLIAYILDNNIIKIENLCDKLYWRNLNSEEIDHKVLTIYKHIMNHVEYADIFDKLAYFRYFDDDILAQVYWKWFEPKYRFLHPIRKISESKIVFNTDFNAKNINKALRTIFILKSRQDENFIERLEEAQEIYEKTLDMLLDTYPRDIDIHLDLNKIILYLQEYLYLELNILYYKNKSKRLVDINIFLDTFENKINKLIDEIVKIKPSGYKKPIEKILSRLKQGFKQNDFKFYVCFFFKEEFDTQPYRMLMRRIVELEEEIEGE